jgi:hypothetical protein
MSLYLQHHPAHVQESPRSFDPWPQIAWPQSVWHHLELVRNAISGFPPRSTESGSDPQVIHVHRVKKNTPLLLYIQTLVIPSLHRFWYFQNHRDHVLLNTFLTVLGFELRAQDLLGRHSTIRATPPALFALVIWEIESSLLVQACLDHNPSILCFPLGVTGMCHHCPAFSCWDGGLTNFFAQASLGL